MRNNKMSESLQRELLYPAVSRQSRRVTRKLFCARIPVDVRWELGHIGSGPDAQMGSALEIKEVVPEIGGCMPEDQSGLPLPFGRKRRKEDNFGRSREVWPSKKPRVRGCSEETKRREPLAEVGPYY